jgi:hypothetical protein
LFRNNDYSKPPPSRPESDDVKKKADQFIRDERDDKDRYISADIQAPDFKRDEKND